ncbi:MAG: bifunctional metallophosphatase/5'-nucleotidase [Bacteroidia bacterium]|nr:bifunctional metallophosphatase/5'-nucleotidase [Bacteroidia bacterium]
MRTNRQLFILLLLTSLLLISACNRKIAKALKGDDDKIEIAIIQLNDVYEISGVDGGKAGNLARVAAFADSIRNKYPANLMMLAGDFLNPSLINTMKYEGERIRGKQMIEVLNAMDMDVVAFGNHEFDFDYEDLQARINESNFDWVATNIQLKQGKSIQDFYRENEQGKSTIPTTQTYMLSDADGTKIDLGVFSATIDSNPRDYVNYLDADSCAHLAINKLKEDHEIILGLTHLSLPEDIALAKAEQDVDLIIGGHEHDYRFEEVGEVRIAKADANAKTLYLHILSYDKKTKQLEIQSDLIPVDGRMNKSPEVAAIIDKWDKILNQEITQVIADPYAVVYKSRQVLDGRESSIRHKQGRMGELLTKSMMAAVKQYPDIGMLNSGSIRIDDELEGDILGIDIFRTLPFGGSIIEVDMKGSLLFGVLRYSENHKGTGAYLQYSGLAKSGEDWQVNGSPLDHDKYYRVVMNDFLLMGYDIPFLKEDNKGIRNISKPGKDDKKDIRTDIRAVVIDYLKKLK